VTDRILSQPLYGDDYINFARFPPGEYWKIEKEPNSVFRDPGRFIKYDRAAVVNIVAGGVTKCELAKKTLYDDKVHRQIAIHPLAGEWDRVVTVIGSAYQLGKLDLSSFKGGILFEAIPMWGMFFQQRICTQLIIFHCSLKGRKRSEQWPGSTGF